MRKIVLTLLFSIVVGISYGSEFGVWNLACDSKTNPVGVSLSEITFSWEPQSNVRNAFQTGYRIGVSSSMDNLIKNRFDVWDSRRVESNKSVQIPYGGATSLKPATKYYWKVMVWGAKRGGSRWSEPATFVTALSNKADWKNARWIGLEEMPEEERVVPGIHNLGNPKFQNKLNKRAQVPYFRKDLTLRKTVREAYLFISGLGHYEAYINGNKVGDHFLAPGWTDYDKRVLYNVYDVSKLLNAGRNSLSTIVGNGFHYINRERYLKLGIAFGYPKMIARLKVVYDDGTEENIVTDKTWRATPSPITFSSIYGGEDHNALREQNGWNKREFNASWWSFANEVKAPAGELHPETDYPVRLFESFPHTIVHAIGDGRWTYDFGQNASGIIHVKIRGKRGQQIKFYPAELVHLNKTPNQQASGAPYLYTYTCKGEEVEEFTPKFSYYGFRYVTIEGAQPAGVTAGEEPVIEEIYLMHNRNASPKVGAFECSNDLLNRIYSLIDWAIKSNFQSILTDCPHREKLGWLEQTHLMGNSIRYNYSLYHLYRKQIYDMIDAQTESGLVPDIAPEYVEFEGGFRDSPEWGSAAVILPWMIYKWYGDPTLLSVAYPMMGKYVEYLKGKSDNHLVSHGLGDWFDYGPKQPGVAQLTPISLTATAIYFYDVKLLAEIAGVLGKTEDQSRYTVWAEEIKKQFNKTFYDDTKKSYSTGSQTALAMPLCVGLVEESNREEVFNTLNETLKRENYALTAGDVGFHYLVSALSEGGFSESLYKMINRDDVPGYGYQLAKGATALTESWPALENVSNNHLMLGHIMEWFYTCLLGINDAPDAVASNKLIIEPMPVGDLTSAKGHYLSPRGKITSEWSKTADSFTLKLTIPDNTEAEVIIPEGYSKVLESDQPIQGRRDIQVIKLEGNVRLKIGGGKYEIKATK